MTRLLNSAFLLLTGVLLGWWLHDQQLSTPPVIAPYIVSDSASALGIPSPAASTVSPVNSNMPTAINPETDPGVTARRFRQLLEQQDFGQAVAYYERALLLDIDHQMLLKPVLQNYLNACLQQCNEGVFIDLAEVWLTSYYEDIPVLLLLAEYQRQQGLPGEAARVLHMAMTYSYLPGQSERVTRALRHLVDHTDEYLSQQQRWIELAGFYELLATIDISQPEFALRQATIYRLLGEPERARALLLALRSSDNQLDPQWTQTLDLQLADTNPEPEPQAVPVNALPVSRQGDHYLIEAILNNREQVTLMIDTGASVTSLSRTSFQRLGRAQFDRMGSHLFKTANGMAQGEVYRAQSIALGDIRLDGIDVAVLDYVSPDGADGLLGMNVLRNFRFEIDQDNDLLYLQPR